MRRTTIALTLVVLMLLLNAPGLMGGGGPLPSAIPPDFVLSTDALRAFIVMDPHEVRTTSTAKQAFISLQDTHSTSQVLYAQGTFNVPDGFPLFLGCALNMTNTRFVGGPAIEARVSLSAWMDENFMKLLFQQLGRTVDGTNIPVITQVVNLDPITEMPGQCTPDPRNPGTGSPPTLLNPDGSPSVPGWLVMDAVIRFAQPPRR